jgi:TonB family protein
MSPQSLLFSSDQETVRMLRQALYELEFEVEHCPEIFAAVERLTSRSFDVIVTDFDDGLEANFLLKTSRELKANSGAFTLAITSDRDANATARRVGADLVLNKPIVTEVAKYSLLTSDAFLRSMRNWLPKLQIGGGPAAPRVQPSVVAVAVPETSAPANTAQARPSSSGRSASNALNRRPPALPLRRSTEPLALWPYDSRVHAKNHHRSAALVLTAAMAMVFLSVGYVFSEPTRSHSVVGSVAIACERVLTKTQSWLRAPQEGGEDSTSEWAQNDEPGTPGSRKTPRIRVTEIHDPSDAAPKLASAPQPQPADSRYEPAQVARVTAPPIIPQSLRTPVSPTAEAPAKAPSSLLAALQPVDLPEDFSNKLILQKVEPNYPAQAMQAGLQGAVVLRAWIGKDGRIEDLKLIHGSLLLGQAAYQAVKQWRYKPYLLNGQAVEAQTYVTVDFKLPLIR